MNKELVRQAITGIDSGFNWKEESKEGYAFWSEVRDRLKELFFKGATSERTPVKIVPAEEAEAKTQIEKVEARVKAYRKERDQPKVPQPEEAAKIATRS